MVSKDGMTIQLPNAKTLYIWTEAKLIAYHILSIKVNVYLQLVRVPDNKLEVYSYLKGAPPPRVGIDILQ